ncbi:ABC transporter permease [Metamycoplasma buccale]|uniref:ABC transporter permease n=1 Tax=Metamycoplasma buccale TaxID=55602 RepID=UPI00398EBA83
MDLANSVYTSLLIYFCIFSVSAIGGMFSEKAGIINIGINGMMIIGAVSYLVFTNQIAKWFASSSSLQTSMYWQLLGIPFAALCAGIFAMLHGFATIKLKSNHTISGFAINLLAAGISLILLQIFGNNSKTPKMLLEELKWTQSDGVRKWEIISFKTVLTILIIIVSYLALYKTKWGLRFRSVGENPQAADVAGINFNKIKWEGVIISGVLSGLAGAFFAHAFPASFKGEVNGFGYLALAIMIMGQWNVGLITIIALLFSILYSFAYNASAFLNFLKPYRYLFIAIPYIVTIIVVMATAKKSHAPAASGIPYDKSIR